MTVLSPISALPAKFIRAISRSAIEKSYQDELSTSVANYLGDISDISIYECRQTGYRFYYPVNLVGDAQFYATLQAQGEYYPHWKWENEKAMKYIQEGDRVLDVGCGEGNFLKELAKKGIKKSVGIDLSSGTLNYVETEGITIINETIESFSLKNKDLFDVIVCFQILEHIADVRSFIKSCLQCLKPNGYLIIAVPNSDPYLYKNDMLHSLNLPPHHAGLWNKKALASLGAYFKLKTLELEIEPIGEHLPKYINVQIENAKANSPFFSWLLNFSMVKKIYYKYLNSMRNKIEGRNLFAVFQAVN